MRFLFVMDPFQRLNPAGDTTLAWMAEAGARGHETLWCEPGDLGCDHDAAVARARPARVRLGAGQETSLGEAAAVALADCDAVLMRKDPPIDEAYHLATLILDRAAARTLIVNHPRGLRDWNEKLAALRFPDLTPPTVVTRDAARLRALLADWPEGAVVKPLTRAGGEGVLHLTAGDPNVNALIELATDFSRAWTVAQRCLPGARAGDKRILLLDGEVAGAVLRVPAAGEFRANLHVGARAVRTDLTAREREICARVAPALAADGQYFAGLDVIDGWLTEVNVTSPTGIREVAAVEGTRLEVPFLDWLERKARERRAE